jgi:acyl carrier protein
VTQLDLRAAVRAHVAALGGPAEPADELDLFATGALASMQLLELITRVEDAHGIRVDDRDVHGGRLRSVAQIALLIAERRGGS